MARRKVDNEENSKMGADRIAEIINASSDSFDLLKDSEDSIEIPLRRKLPT